MTEIEDSVLIYDDDDTYSVELKTDAVSPETAAERMQAAKEAVKSALSEDDSN